MVEEATLESQLNAAELHAFKNPQENQFSPLMTHISSSQSCSISRPWITLPPREPTLHHAGTSTRICSHMTRSSGGYLTSLDSLPGSFTCVWTLAGPLPVPVRSWRNVLITKSLTTTKKNSRNRTAETMFLKKSFLHSLLAPTPGRWKNSEMAREMYYRYGKTQEELNRDRGPDYVYDDISCGSGFLDAVRQGRIGKYDTVVYNAFRRPRGYTATKI